MTNAQMSGLLELLSTNSVANVQNGLIHALGLWLEMYVKGAEVDRRKQEAYSTFVSSVWEVAKQRQYQRKVWPKSKPLPFPYNQLKVIEAISREVLREMKGLSFHQGLVFLAKLWGGWVLICPEAILRNSPEFASVIETVQDEDELIEQMLWYLDIYGNM
jgi:hypothetical protein